MKTNAPRSDALVSFGASGDLAYKKIFPAFQAMARRGKLNFSVIGVGRFGWNREQLVARARASVSEYGGLDAQAFATLAERIEYVDGDYNDPATFEELHAILCQRHAQRPAHYLAIPPSVFPSVITEVLVELRNAPPVVFAEPAPQLGNYIRFRLSPSVAIGIGARAKRGGDVMVGDPVELSVVEEGVQGQAGRLGDYERLLGDAMAGDATLFARQDVVEAAWAIVDPALRVTAPLHEYEPGSSGPREAKRLQPNQDR